MIRVVLACLLLAGCAVAWEHGAPGQTPYDYQAWQSGVAACAEIGLRYNGQGCVP